MVNQKGPTQMKIGVMPLEMIEVNKDASDVIKRGISKETAWQKMSTCTTRRRVMKMLT